MRNLGFEMNNVDPCLFYKQENSEFCIISLYVDNIIMTEDINLMVKAVDELRKVSEV
jgi:hypothetical protein